MNLSSDSLQVGLVQINNSFSGQNYLPYSVGVLQAYAQAQLENRDRFHFKLPLYARGKVEKAVRTLEDADIVFFSAYVWNFRISLEIARALKARRPDAVIIMGGPHVPDRIEGFLEQYPFIDLVVHGEGELPFLAILKQGIASLRAKHFDGIPSVSFLAPGGKLVRHPQLERLKDINGIPSPYLSGLFEPLMEANPNEKWIVLWETNRGCPFSCTYCDWGSATQSRVARFDIERLYREVDWFADRRIEFIFCADANFGMLPRDLDIAAYVAESKRKKDFPHALSVQNTKNATERAYKVQKLLADAGLNKGVTIAFQSLDVETLKAIKRSNISTESFQELQRRFTRDRIETYTDIILGLPGETYETMVQGVCTVIENGQHNRIQFGNLSILPNAEMGDPEYQKRYAFDMVETPVVNIHGSLATTDNEILETQVLVVANNTVTRPEWVRVRSFAWMCSLLHFNKVLQIPLLLLHSQGKVPFRELLTLFSDGDLTGFPILAGLREFFHETARKMQCGGAEYVSSEKWLGIWWPADELALIEICAEDKIDAFYDECERVFLRFMRERAVAVPEEALRDAIRLNHGLLKLPFQKENLAIDLCYNIWEVYEAARVCEDTGLVKSPNRRIVDRTTKAWQSWQDWCREVIWWGNKKGAYLYTNALAEPQLSGHF